MARFMIKASEYKNVCKTVNDRELAALKKEIIEILKKQDEKEFKKAIDYLNSQESHFTHLEKSITGKWIEKAGYGIGTVRVWKGKKYKKIAPDKWVRVFDKEGRGTNIAIGKLIAKVNKIDNVEDLMAFVMANKQRFVDENGIDLPVLDKLRAAVDARNNGTMGSKKETAPMSADKVKEIHDKIEENRKKGKKVTPSKPSTGVYAPSESTDMETKKAIAENKSVGENEVQLPYSKELEAEIKSLKNCTSTDPTREFMNYVYYENGNLIATDGRRMKLVKVGELDGIENGSYVDIDISKNGINLKKREGMEGKQYPNYSRVIPDDLSQKVTLKNDVIKEKIKEMKKDGAIDKKVGRVQLEFKDGKVYLDDTEIGEAQNINLKYSDDWGPARNETNLINVNADYLVNALNGNSSILMLGERSDKAMGISTDSTTNIIMPMNGSDTKMDYSAGRSEKAAENEKKNKEKAEIREFNEKVIEQYTPKDPNVNVEQVIERMKSMSDEDLKREYGRLNFDFNKVMDKRRFLLGTNKVDSKLGLDLRTAAAYKGIVNKYPEIKDKVIAELESRGISVKKSLFDGFLGFELLEEDIDDIEEDKEEESLFNDYSAEQPDLFNSTEFKVREAFNRCCDNCL